MLQPHFVDYFDKVRVFYIKVLNLNKNDKSRTLFLILYRACGKSIHLILSKKTLHSRVFDLSLRLWGSLQTRQDEA